MGPITRAASVAPSNSSIHGNEPRPERASLRSVITPIPMEIANTTSDEDVVLETNKDDDGNRKTAVKKEKFIKKISPITATVASTTTTKKSKSQSKKSSCRKRKPSNKESKKNGKALKEDEIVDSSFLIAPSESDSDDEKDRPFRAEYASTCRAACRSCDEKIGKNILRIATRPLFRGKPGFVGYRHLKCQIFPNEITKIEQVGGWRRLKSNDRLLLRQQLDESKLKIEEENKEMNADELVQIAFQGELREAPPGLAATLLPFQREGVSWMYNQEVNEKEIKGGILADEMGMGKTLQTLTTMLDNRPKLQHTKPFSKHSPSAPDLQERIKEDILWKDALKTCQNNLKMADVPQQILVTKKKKGAAPVGVRAGTLVVSPLIAINQWKEEITKFTEENALTVCIYHGNKRHSMFPSEILCKYDVVITTYQVLEADFRKMVSPNKVKCPNCGRSFKMDKLGVHLKYFCGETAQRTEAQSRQHRTANGPQQPRNDSARGNKNKKSMKPETKKFPVKKSKISQAHEKKTKKVVRRSFAKGYDSESELSVSEDLDMTSKRPSRSAARTAKRRLTDTSKDWADGIEGDSESFSDDNQYSSDDTVSSNDSSAAIHSAAATKGKKQMSNEDDVDSSSDEDDSDSEDESAIARAQKRQKLALSKVKEIRKKEFPGKKGEKKEKGKGSIRNKKTAKKSALCDDDDPLKGIDMEELKEKAMQGCQVSVLHTMSWWRIVLDEAHMIKSRSSSTASAAFHLSGIYRWALSGTPLQNRVGELYSLIRFLRIDPMAHYCCRRQGCDCKSIYYRMDHGKCRDCGHASSQHFSYFNKHVLNVIQREGYSGDGRRAMMKLKVEVLDKCLLRRTKESRAEDMNLPPRVVIIKPIRLHPREEDFYNALYTQTKSSFDDYVAEGTLLNNYAHIFDLLTKMRQAVDHPYMIVHSKKNHTRTQQQQQGGHVVANGSTECELCEDTPTDRVLSSCCNSAFCRICVIDMMTLEDVGENSTRCPCCRAPFSIDLNQESHQIVDNGTLAVKDTCGMPSLKQMRNVASGSILKRINLAEFSTSTKIEKLVEELFEMREERPGSKALVFSQFTSMLDLVRWRLISDPCLQDLGIGVRIIHGGMNVTSREEALKAFREDSSVRVLLMSLKAGGVALNLTVANEVFLLDPWWNPAAEMQAIDRTHRLGQFRPIRAVRFIAEGTVEERVLQLQEKKRLVFDGTVGRDAASLKMLTVDDMKSLFT